MSNFLHLEGNCLEIKGAVKVVSSSQSQAVVETVDSGVVITGTEIEVIFSGKFINLKFGTISTKKVPLYKRIFK